MAALLVKSAWIHALQYNEARQNDGGASTRLPAAPAKCLPRSPSLWPAYERQQVRW